MLITSSGVTGYIDIIAVSLEGSDHRTELLVLAAVIAENRTAPVACGRFARLVDDHAIVRDRLGEVVCQVLTVLEFAVARAGVKSQETAMVNHEIQGVIVAMLGQGSATGEETVRIVFSGAGSHEYLAHVVKVSCAGEVFRKERFGRAIGLR